MKAFAAALFIAATTATEAEAEGSWWSGRSLSRGNLGSRVINRGTLGSKLVKTGYTTKTVIDEKKVLVPEKRVRQSYELIDDIVYRNVDRTIIENVPRQVIDEIVNTVIDTVPRKVIDQVKKTTLRRDVINESNDSGDGRDSDERIYVASVSSNDSCDGWGCQSSNDSGYCGWGKRAWNGQCQSSNDSQSSYVITSDSSADERVVITPVTTVENVERTVLDKVPRQVKTQRARTVIDKVPRTITERVATKVQRRVPKTTVDTVLREKTIRTPRQVKVPTVQRVAVAGPLRSSGRVLSNRGGLAYRGGYKW